MQNRLEDANNHLFDMLERLMDEDKTKEELDKDIKRAKAVVDVTEKIVDVASLRFRGLVWAGKNMTQQPDFMEKSLPAKEPPKELPNVPHTGKAPQW